MSKRKAEPFEAQAGLFGPEEPHPNEEALLSLFDTTALPDAAGVVREARALGVPWATILQVLIQAGPAFGQMLQLILQALKSQPPVVEKEDAGQE